MTFVLAVFVATVAMFFVVYELTAEGERRMAAIYLGMGAQFLVRGTGVLHAFGKVRGKFDFFNV